MNISTFYRLCTLLPMRPYLLSILLMAQGIAYAQEADHHHDEPTPDEPSSGLHTEISLEMAKAVGIQTDEAGPGTIERHILVYGRLHTPPRNSVQIKARFPGLIKEVLVDVGDSVDKGELLATIESDASLQDYQLRSPIDAVIQDRFGNAGEIAGDSPIFVLVNNEQLWAELKVFPGQRFEIEVGQDVHIIHNEHSHNSKISSITPASNTQPYVVARVVLENTYGDMAPGDMVSGQIDAEKIDVPITVENRAIQNMDSVDVVFIREGNRYIPRPVELGRTDGNRTEVLSGLQSGDNYVVENSYLIKADIEKSEAGHEH